MNFDHNSLLLTPLSISLESDSLNLLQSALTGSQNYLSSFAEDSDFAQKMAIAFGDSIDPSQLQTAWLNSDFSSFPPIEVRYQSDLNGTYGAYSSLNRVIYLSYEYLQQVTDVEDLTALLLEEYGHHLDVLLNGNVDTEGDEGAIFARVVQGETITVEELQALQAEDDTAIITLDGQTITVEGSSDLDESSNGSTEIASTALYVANILSSGLIVEEVELNNSHL
ncbi:MAG: hypothetical protein MK111_24800 [Crocosphaera sp.]|uniref:hypothetical protein n=1 Tax=Crocosphaera sp. TaxID=2729996 RepID=UPI00258E934C|nr:hypothetical protein [Crocosphaera sp.]MCH2247808.1 hypothetical protein [Crocosphaera sp.]